MVYILYTLSYSVKTSLIHAKHSHMTVTNSNNGINSKYHCEVFAEVSERFKQFVDEVNK